MPGLMSWEGQSVDVSSMMSSKRCLLSIVQVDRKHGIDRKSWRGNSN